MNETHCGVRQLFIRLSSLRLLSIRTSLSHLFSALGAGVCILLSACGGSADAPPPPESGPVVPTAVPPTITLQPVSVSVTTGQPASFSVAASGTAPITWQWQRNGVAIAGATTTSYTIATTAMTDSGAVFAAVATNVAGSATSNDATLTVTAAAPVLTITPQPASTSVVAGATAIFTVGGTCSSGMLDVQWRRSNDGGTTFVPVAGATSTTYSVMAATGDSGAQFDAVLDCSGQSAATSLGAVLTVTAPGSVTVSLLPIVGLRAQADVGQPAGIVEDNLYSYSFVAYNSVKRLSADLSTVTTIAGLVQTGAADGPGATASFRGPKGITHDGPGNLYVTDTGNNTIRKIASDGTVSTLAGSAGTTGSADGSGSAASFNGPTGIAIGPEGDLYVADTGNNLIRRVTTAGVVTTYAGVRGLANFADGPPSSAKFSAPMGVAVASTGDVYVSDSGNQRVRWIARVGGIGGTAGNVGTVAGDGSAGTADGVGIAAQIPGPAAIGISASTLYVSDATQRVRKIDLTSLAVTTFAGSNDAGTTLSDVDGPVGSAHFDTLAGIVPTTLGGLLVTDFFSIRHVSAAGSAVTIATGAVPFHSGTGVGTLSQLPFELGPYAPGLLVEPDKSVDVLDPGTTLLRRISPFGMVSPIAGLPDALSNGAAIDGQASGAQFNPEAQQIARDASGTLYVADHCGVRRITTDGTVSFIAGSAVCGTQADGSGSAAVFSFPKGIAIGPNGDLFVSDLYEIRRVTTSGVVSTYAGSTVSGSADGPVLAARFNGPYQLSFGADGTLYVIDGNLAIRTISPDGQQVSTLPGLTADALAVDSSGTVYYSGTGPQGATGLHQRTAAGVDTFLVHSGSAVVLGSNGVLPLATAIAIYGPKQLVLSAVGESALYVVTMP